MSGGWERFERPQQVELFIGAAAELHHEQVDQLDEVERPQFFDHWARVLNLSDCYLQDDPLALVTYPRTRDRHPYRWQISAFLRHADKHTLHDVPCVFDGGGPPQSEAVELARGKFVKTVQSLFVPGRDIGKEREPYPLG